MSNDANQPSTNPDPGANRSRTPTSEQFLAYMGSGWGEHPQTKVEASPATEY
ncbi:MAG: hypothetical protein RJA66_973, partial [Actinomycetota bacterium]